MATSSKQYKAIGEDLWKGRTEKIVRSLSPHVDNVSSHFTI